MTEQVRALNAYNSFGIPAVMKEDIRRHLMSNLGTDPDRADSYRVFKATAYAVRDQLVKRWIETQRSYYDEHAKRVYYLSLEFLLGRLLSNCLINLGLEETCVEALKELGFSLEEVAEQEVDAGLGNGGLGRLAACFMDSIATLGMPAYGYGILYDYGMFIQDIVDGFQVEKPDNWLRQGNPWEIDRPDYLYTVEFGGWVEPYTDEGGRLRHRWHAAEKVQAMPCDILVPGYGTHNVINLRLWSAKATRDFNLEYFQKGDYVEAIEEKARSENISKVLYPSEEVRAGRRLRLKQEYFFVSATFQDIMRRFKKRHPDFSVFPDRVAIQLNDTHPAVAIPELMRLLVDQEQLGWEQAWDICQKSFGYTNHTVMPEALETWPVEIMGSVLPRHLEIIFEINRRFLEDVSARWPGDVERLRRMSIIQETPEKRVRMAHLAIVGSHSVNGVAAVHTEILKARVFPDFLEMFPGRFNNKTNGITPRRWLLQANPRLAELITEKVGPAWAADLTRLNELAPLADDPEFRARFRGIKRENKRRLAEYIGRECGLELDLDSIFDVQVKRLHEYKRQLLNLLHVVALYNRMKNGRPADFTPRSVIFGGKAAPGYHMAKLIIKLINSVAAKVNTDEALEGRLKVVFVPNYCVSSAEIIIPGADLSEQISTAGTEASGTGNMKFALNGALTIGTLDGANIEIADAVGRENIFIFGLDADQAVRLQAGGYEPLSYYREDGTLKTVLDQISSGLFCPEKPDLFKPITDSLLHGGDRFLVLADFRDYLRCQEEAARVFLDQEEWARRAVLNVARMDRFSTDRTIQQYADEIWRVTPVLVD
ncbi:MAG: glycogen/starch/alpha-glucan phosphorylase [Thermodesulfobacteriota bacterium]